MADSVVDAIAALDPEIQERLRTECSERDAHIIAVQFGLRGYQIRAVLDIRRHMREGRKSILLCSPTGSGKTRIASCIVYMAQEKARANRKPGDEIARTAFVVDQVNLIDQTGSEFVRAGIEYGVVQADHPLFHPSRPVQICSAQTLDRRSWPVNTKLVLVDEAHTIRKVIIDKITPRDTMTIGLTATPFTKGLGKLYDVVVNVTTTQALIDSGFLSNYKIFAPSEPDMTGVRAGARGEYETKEASKRALEVVGDCVVEYLKHGNGRKFICSAVDIAHARELHRQFIAAGVQCAVYTSKELTQERSDIVTEFRKPDSYIRGLVTVTAATKGFDVPDIGVVIMARPLRKSLSEFIQFFGRGLRTYPGKEECLVLDHAGNCHRFRNEWATFFEDGAFDLDDGTKKPKEAKRPDDGEDRMVKCGECKCMHKPMPFCPECGHEYPAREAVKHVGGTLTELISSGDRKTLTKSVWPQVCGYVRNLAKPALSPEKRAKAIYFSITKTWPAQDFDATESAPLTPEIAGQIKRVNVAYAKARQAQRAQA